MVAHQCWSRYRRSSSPQRCRRSARAPRHPKRPAHPRPFLDRPLAVTSRDSTRALRLAHRAQGDFESLRRRLLPHEKLAGARGCDAVVGRYCYLQQVASAAPDEAPEVVAARTRLLATLDSLGAMIPGDRWILGQKVRYLIEAGRPQAADSMGVACAAQSDGAHDGELVSRARRLYGAAVRQLSARRRGLHVGARGDAGVGTLQVGGSRAAPRSAPPDRTGAWTASRAIR